MTDDSPKATMEKIKAPTMSMPMAIKNFDAGELFSHIALNCMEVYLCGECTLVPSLFKEIWLIIENSIFAIGRNGDGAKRRRREKGMNNREAPAVQCYELECIKQDYMRFFF